MLRVALISLGLLGCVTVEPDADATSGAPLLGVDGSLDQADRNCHVVLREMTRNWTGFTWESVVTSTGSASYVWQGTVEISQEALAEGLVPRVLYQSGSDPAWREATGTPAAGAATPGYARFSVRISEGLPGPGMSATSMMSTRIQVVPFLRMAGDGRLFDHNRHPNDFDNHVITYPDLAIGTHAATCPAPAGPQRATLVFAADGSEHRDGVLVPGGEMTIAYDVARLPTCRHSQNGNKLWEMTAHVRFEPSFELRTVSVRDAAATLVVPANTEAVSLWFENTSASGCQAWDSNLGANYHFAAAAAPQWIGNVTNLLARSPSDECHGGIPAAQGVRFDTWVRERASATNLCFEIYEPGLTDRDDPDLWQKLDVRVTWRHVGDTTWQTRWVDFDRREGNNARYRMSRRALDPFRTYHCPEVEPVVTTDGQHAAVQLEYYLVVNGAEVRPAPGAGFAATFVDHATGYWSSQSCP